MKTKLLILLTVLLFTSIPKAQARIVYFGSELETITVAYGGATILRFPEEVKTISQATRFTITPADPKQPDYKVLSIIPRFTRGTNKIVFILSNGQIINTNVKIVSKKLPEQVDSFYDFRPKDDLLEKMDQNSKGTQISELELMKAMIKQEQVAGYHLRKLVRTIDSGVEDLSVKLIRIYTGAKYNGYVFRIENQSKKQKYSIDISKLALGNPNTALLSEIDRKTIEPLKSGKSIAHLRIVAKPASIYYNVSLPFEKKSSEVTQ